MDFEPVTQNGIDPQTEYFILPSRFALAVSTTTFVRTQIITLTAYSDAQIYKRKPVTFYAKNTSTDAVSVIGSGTWISTTTCQIRTSNVPVDTGAIYASWPGELKYAPKSTELNTIPVTIIPGYALGRAINMTATPNPVAVNENVTLRATTTASNAITNGSKIDWYANSINIGNSTFNSGASVFTATFASTGTQSIYGIWNGGLLNGSAYLSQQTANTVSLEVNERQTLSGQLLLSANKSAITTAESITFTSILNTTTIVTGTTVTFIGGTSTGSTITSVISLVDNIASFTIPPNTLTLGNYTMTATWSGRTITPKYYPKTSDTVYFTAQVPQTPSFGLTITPSTYRRYDSAGTANPSTIVTATIAVGTGWGSPHTPTGTVSVYDVGTNSLLTSTTITTSGTYNLTWNPITANQYQQGVRTIRAVYNGDNYNTSATTTATFRALGSDAVNNIQGLYSIGGTFLYPDGGNGSYGGTGVVHLTTSSTATCYTTATFKWVNANTSATYTATNLTGTITFWSRYIVDPDNGGADTAKTIPYVLGTATLVNNVITPIKVGFRMEPYYYPGPAYVWWEYSGNSVYEGKHPTVYLAGQGYYSEQSSNVYINN
jgi:hypothetical protein